MIILQSGQRHALHGDWIKAITSFQKSLEGFEAVYSKKDKRVVEVSRLLKVSSNSFSYFEYYRGDLHCLSSSLFFSLDSA